MFGDKVISVNVERTDPNFKSKLTDEQLKHESETALDNFDSFDILVKAEDMKELEDSILEVSKLI